MFVFIQVRKDTFTRAALKQKQVYLPMYKSCDLCQYSLIIHTLVSVNLCGKFQGTCILWNTELVDYLKQLLLFNDLNFTLSKHTSSTYIPRKFP